MGRVGEFEQLIAWQRARRLTVQVYTACRSGPLSGDFGLSRQMQRAAVSIMANIAEGHERGSAREFVRFLSIAKASCAELRSHLYVAGDVGLLEVAAVDKLLADTAEVARLLGGLRRSVLARSKPDPTDPPPGS